MIKHLPNSDEVWAVIPPGQGYFYLNGIDIKNNSDKTIRVCVEVIEPDEID